MAWTIDRDADGQPVRLLYARPVEPVEKQIKVREGGNTRIRALFLSKPYKWIGWKELQKCGGGCGWRSRVSQVRKIVQQDGADIQWNGDPKDSRYRYLTQRPQGPDAAVPRERKLF